MNEPGPDSSAAALRRTPLYELHRARGAKMVPFAGYEMPVQYPAGIIAEHLHTRAQAGLFDVSHMGQIRLRGAEAARALEALVPGDLQALMPRQMRYTLLLNDRGGILDDLMATRVPEEAGDGLMLVVNAACKEADLAHLQAYLDRAVAIEPQFERALLALQGPAAAAVLARFAAGVERMKFMSAAEVSIAGISCGITRSGYTGEDGFEISVSAEQAAALAERLLGEPEVMPIGLGARDTLRLEAGLCLYGHDIDRTTTPIEAGLAWTIGKRRRAEGGFPGAAMILRQLAEGTARKRVGIRPDGRAPMPERFDFVPIALTFSQLFLRLLSHRRSCGTSLTQLTTTSISPSLSKSPNAAPRLDFLSCTPGPEIALTSSKIPWPRLR